MIENKFDFRFSHFDYDSRISNNDFRNGFSLVEVLVGTFLVLIVFLGIFGAYQLGLKVIGLSQRKIVATQIAQGEIEKIRNLPYLSVGTIGAQLPYAKGNLDPLSFVYLNGIEYKIERIIKFVVDPADGTGDEDSCNWDYKKAEIKISWSGRFSGNVQLVTDVAPKDKVEEVQTCQEQPGGILSILVFDAQGIMVASPLIEVFDPQSGFLVDSATPSDGKYDFPLTAGTYKVVVSKSGYSSERTYGTEEIVIPEKPHPIVLEGQVTPISFSIDKLSSFLVETLSPWGTDYFFDSFSDETKVSEKFDVVVSEGRAILAASNGNYPSVGHLISVAISPANLQQWKEFSFNDEEPAETDLRYQIFYLSGENWVLIPDSDLPGNSVGFDSSPVDLSHLSVTTYSQLKLKANFSSNNPSATPALYDWQVSWIATQPTPIGNVRFNLRGEKLIGKDANENPIFKYNQDHQTDSQGKKEILGLEWDNYIFSVDPATGVDLVSTDPSPQPISLAPDTNLTVKLYLEAQNSLLVTVQNEETLEPIFSASVRLFKADYDQTQYTNEKGQTLFIPLDVGDYNLEISAPGYAAFSSTVSVSGDVVKTIKLHQLE